MTFPSSSSLLSIHSSLIYSIGKHIYLPILTWTLFEQSCSQKFTKDLIFHGSISAAQEKFTGVKVNFIA